MTIFINKPVDYITIYPETNRGVPEKNIIILKNPQKINSKGTKLI